MRNDLTELRRRVLEDPDNANLVLRLALTLDRKGRGDEALEQWERVLDLDETVLLAWTRIARLHSDRNLLASALEAYHKSFECVGKDAEESLMRRGWSILRDRAAAFRAKASSISGRFSKDAKVNPELNADKDDSKDDKLDLPKTIELWFKAESYRNEQEFDQCHSWLIKTARSLMLSDWPPPVTAQTKSVINLAEDCSWCQKLQSLLLDDLRLPILLASSQMTLVLVSGALERRGDLKKTFDLKEHPKPLLLFVRGPQAIQHPLSSAAPVRQIGSLRMLDNEEVQAFDESGRKLADIDQVNQVSPWLKDYVLAWAACDIGEFIIKFLFEDYDPSRELAVNG